MAEPIPVAPERRRIERRTNPTLAELTLPELRRMMVEYGEEFWKACGVDQPSASASEREGEAALEECFSADWEDDGPP